MVDDGKLCVGDSKVDLGGEHGGRPHDIAYSPDGKFALVPNFDKGIVTRLNAEQPPFVGRPKKILEGLSHPCGVAISPCSTFGLVGDLDRGMVVRFDLLKENGGKAVKNAEYSGFNQTMKMAIAPSGEWALVTNWGDGNLRRLDLKTGEVKTLCSGFTNGR